MSAIFKPEIIWQLMFPFCLFCGELALAQTFEKTALFDLQYQLKDTNGVAVADYDADGDLDVYLVAVDTFHGGRPQNWNRLLRNDGEGVFIDVTEESGLMKQAGHIKRGWFGAKMGASWGDYNNDGFPDLFLSNFGEDVLWKNLGNGQALAA